MGYLSDRITTARDKSWAWFQTHAHRPHALGWLALVAFTDAIDSPLVPEAFLAALMLARRDRWKQYLSVAAVSSIVGSAVGYVIAVFIFRQFGAPLLEFYGLEGAFATAQNLIVGQVFFAMMIASFTPIPDKVFIYAGGFLGAPFVPFIVGYAIGRIARMGLVVYVTGMFGEQVLALVNRYFLYVTGVIFALVALYAIVHLHLFGL